MRSHWISMCVLPFLVSSLALAQSPSEDLRTPESFQRFPPLLPDEAEASFVVQEGFRMQLIAAEPLITDPVAMAFDENGRAYVVEMNDYPYTDKKAHAAWADNTTDRSIGKVRLLDDTDGDGIFDKSTIFVEGLSWPSGIACSRGGVYITATPDIWYCKDADGDGRADERRKVLTGFRKYNVQAIINNPIWGFDSRLYVAGSSNGGSIQSPNDSRKTTWRGDFRIDPKTEIFEPQSGSGRFGNAFDDWGNRFICNIRNPAIQIVLDYETLSRNPFFAAPKAMFDAAEAGDQLPIFRISPVEPWRELRARQWSQDTTKHLPRSELTGGGVFTSASGLAIYRGDQYKEQYLGQAFLGEVANNVIHRQSLTRDGVVYRAQRADQGVEFVASTDTWFRPVNIVNAPDGTLHVLDMYREFIEHPWSIPDDIHERLDLESGRDRGRIYRLLPPNYQPRPRPNLSAATIEQLVQALDHPSAWWRETAQRLLLERAEIQVGLALENRWQNASPRGRIHMLWTLSGLQQLTEPQILRALDDSISQVREQAIMLASSMPESQSINQRLIAAKDDVDARVRFRAAIAIGNLKSDQSCAALADLAIRDGNDPWIRAAILSSPSELTLGIVQDYLKQFQSIATRSNDNLWLRESASILGAQGKADALDPVIHQIESIAGERKMETEAFWSGLLSGLRRNGRTLRQVFMSPSLFATQIVNHRLGDARKIATDSSRSDEDRLSAIDWMSHDDFDIVRATLTSLIDEFPSQKIQLAAIQAISTYRHPEVARLLLDRWRKYTPTIREAVLVALMTRKERILMLFDAIEKGEVAASTIDLARKSQILANKDPSIQDRAKVLFGNTASTARSDVVSRYRESLTLKSDPTRGQAVFVKHCAACHRWQGQGVDMGPNMETVREWDAERILLNIFDPHREVSGQFLTYNVLLQDGRTLSGMIADETATSISIKQKDTAPQAILLSEIEQISNTGLSLMPSGFEEVLSLQDTADLLGVLRSRHQPQ